MRISDWSSDVCSSDLVYRLSPPTARLPVLARPLVVNRVLILAGAFVLRLSVWLPFQGYQPGLWLLLPVTLRPAAASDLCAEAIRSEERVGGKEGVSTLKFGGWPIH